VQRRRRVRVPASTANLGPGYDAFGAALSIHLSIEVEETGGDLRVETDIPGVPADRSNLVVRAFEALHPADGLTFRLVSDIPVSAGLGSSAAAIVAGLVAADHMYELDAPLFELAAELEGHPDNVAAALLGGFVICSRGEPPQRFEPRAGLEGVIVTPPDRVPTAAARAALPAEVPMADAVHNIAHASLLVLGLSTGDLSLVGRGLADRIHQPRREHLYPRSMDLVRRAAEFGAVGASISGAGPTVLFWTHWEQTGHVLEALKRECDDREVRRVQFAPGGADVTAL
jgi:homoserine kinase